MKRPTAPNTTGSPGPRRPEPTWQDILALADTLQARNRARLSQLSSAGRLRRWGKE